MSTGAVNGGNSAAALSPQNYRYLQEYLHRQSGIVLENDKNYLLESRLMPIVAEQKLDGLNALCAVLQRNGSGGLHRQVVEAMTTNETMFFRDSVLWEELKSIILPELIARRKQARRLRFWSAASSSGQETYSLSMALLEMGLQDWDIQIFATDLSERMLERARLGQYSQFEVNRGLPAQYLVKYFVQNRLQWQVKDEVKRWVRFQQMDLRQKLSAFGPFDLILCRNVLIYFDVPTKQQILQKLRGTLLQGGCLVLGSAETVLNLDNSFERRHLTRASFYQVP